MEILQPVRVRGERWRVADVRAYGGCQLLTLVNAAGSRHVLAPFDDVDPIALATRPRHVGARRWRLACRAVLASSAPPGTLRSAVRARIDLLPHQLAPALAVLSGLGSRLLLADDVGLGKTIQAGLVIAELMARHSVERVLVIVPSGVRDQWAEELRVRFAIDASIADARSLRQAAADLPVGVNPWTTYPIAIVSLDYVKRPEVLPAVRVVPWDVVIVDEAHAAAGASDRHEAVRALAGQAPYVLLLTATPHSGDERAFAALCSVGTMADDSGPDPLLLFRRTRRMVRGSRTRRVRTLHVRPSALERRTHEALARYARAVRDEHGDRALALSVLEKRAFSSPWSLAQSVERRLSSLLLPPVDPYRQLSLPLDGDAGESTDDDAPPMWPADLALADVDRERRLLERVLSAAREASTGRDSKLRALRRLLSRIGESALVFTEYRDTAMHMVSAMPRPALLLHGGMDRASRRATIDEFNRGPGAILIATDAAGQGLNLHRACRLVINVELPWNPMRLEQRIGRVDRIGQSRTVHAVHLVARSTGESRILSRLQARVAAARGTLDTPDPICSADFSLAPNPTDSFVIPDLDRECTVETARIESIRPFLDTGADASVEDIENAGPLVTRATRRHLRRALDGRALLVCRIASPNANGHAVESEVFGLFVSHADGMLAAEGRLAPERLIPGALVDQWRARVAAVPARFWSTRLARERAIAQASANSDRVLFQTALFDRRAERAHAASAATTSERERDAHDRLAALERRAPVGEPRIELVLLVLPR